MALQIRATGTVVGAACDVIGVLLGGNKFKVMSVAVTETSEAQIG